MKEIIQHIIFPQNETLEDHYRLYYREFRGLLMMDEGGQQYLAVPQYQNITFNTYFNGCSYGKWKKYTNVDEITLALSLKGTLILRLYGYSLRALEPEKLLLGEYRYSVSEKTDIEIQIPENKEQMVGIEIKTLSECFFYGGAFYGEFPDEKAINLAISTTTCRKEEFITQNVRLLKEQLLDCGEDISHHLFINIVDNGRTLSSKDFPDDQHIHLFPNKNTGGAGGFARGMIEALREKKAITHVLLMDDDVMVQPEAIYRTYTLLKHVRKEYEHNFISGAMLYMENISIQKEDVGYLKKDGYFDVLKREFNQEYLWDNLKNEQDFPLMPHSYAAWWYCCIPAETIRKEGLPMPIFVRGDDVEYGLRCNPGFITMNGICVWHLGFAGKFNVGMDHYQVNRNLLINQAVTGLLDDVNVMRKFQLDFRKHLLRLDYDSAEIALRALEDYLKGPGFIRQDLGEKILFSNNDLGHKMISLAELGDPDIGLGDPYWDPPRKFIEKWLFRLTYNGHRLRFLCKLKPEIMSIPFNDVYTPSRIAFREKLVAVNPVTRTGYILERNQVRYEELRKRYKTAMRTYKKENGRIAKEYRSCREMFRSEEFWKGYLGIE